MCQVSQSRLWWPEPQSKVKHEHNHAKELMNMSGDISVISNYITDDLGFTFLLFYHVYFYEHLTIGFMLFSIWPIIFYGYRVAAQNCLLSPTCHYLWDMLLAFPLHSRLGTHSMRLLKTFSPLCKTSATHSSIVLHYRLNCKACIIRQLCT